MVTCGTKRRFSGVIPHLRTQFATSLCSRSSSAVWSTRPAAILGRENGKGVIAEIVSGTAFVDSSFRSRASLQSGDLHGFNVSRKDQSKVIVFRREPANFLTLVLSGNEFSMSGQFMPE